MNQLADNKKRGVFLVIMIVIYAVWYVAYLVNDILFTFAYYGFPSGGHELLNTLMRITFFLAGGTGLVGVALWRRWGVYLLVATVVVMAAVSLIYSADGEAFVLTVLSLAFMVWAVARKWKILI